MPTKKPDPKTETPNTEPAKAVVSRLGVNDPNPTSDKACSVKTKNGNTITTN